MTVRARVTKAFDKLASKHPDLVQTGSVQQPTPSSGGPSDQYGGPTGDAPDPIPARLVVFEISPHRVDGTNVLAGDYQVIVEPLSIEITEDDMVNCDRGELRIAKLGRVATGGETALYDMVCRA